MIDKIGFSFLVLIAPTPILHVEDDLEKTKIYKQRVDKWSIIVPRNPKRTVLMHAVHTSFPFCVCLLLRCHHDNTNKKMKKVNVQCSFYAGFWWAFHNVTKCRTIFRPEVVIMKLQDNKRDFRPNNVKLRLTAEELIDHWAYQKEWSELFPNAWIFTAKYIGVAGSISRQHVDNLIWTCPKTSSCSRHCKCQGQNMPTTLFVVMAELFYNELLVAIQFDFDYMASLNLTWCRPYVRRILNV